MALKDVLLLGNPRLRKDSKNVVEFDQELKQIIIDLRDTLTHLQKEQKIGRALAAPQIGYFKKVVYCNIDGDEIIMVNPEIVWKSDEMFDVWDSCFSFKTAFFVNISRYKKIKVEYKNMNGEEVTGLFEDDLSELFQHEIDHLYGVLATDHLLDNQKIKMREEWEKTVK